ncbi:hypothetical protein G7Y89_g3302 [Cudoniella acicularis]|uniref:Uncharacterized protein n=1 Tax=Cudoniella acicularis TaxID=354080 RepID=A0A8H4W5A6_9HELO|nr:hypothetical protein G7Y89_g3302 [Cudoniella acicularis]
MIKGREGSGKKIPLNLNSPISRISSQTIPHTHGKINMRRIGATWASIRHRSSNSISLTTNTIIAADIRDLDLLAAVRAIGHIVHESGIAESDNHGAVGVGDAAGAGSALLRVDGSFAVVDGAGAAGRGRGRGGGWCGCGGGGW